MGIRDLLLAAVFYIALLIELIKYSYEKATRAEHAQYKTRCIDDKIAIVTGANTGIGKSTVLELVRRGATVILACRNPLLGEVAMKEIRSKTQAGKMDLMIVDLSDLSSVVNFCHNVRNKYARLDILINNAGVYDTSGTRKTTKDGFELHFGTNYLSHYIMTDMLLELLKNGQDSRIISVSSSLQRFSYPYYDLSDLMLEKDKSWGLFNSLGYAISKYYMSLHMLALQQKVRRYGITCYSACPGFVDTEIFRSFEWYEKLASELAVKIFGIPPEEGCHTTLFLATCDEDVAEGGKFYRFYRQHGAINSKLVMARAVELCDATEEIIYQHRLTCGQNNYI